MKKLCLVLLFVFLFKSVSCLCAEPEKMCLYVDCASKAKESDGSFDKPFLQISDARDEIRRIKEAGQYPENGITVYIRGGQYIVKETLELDERDSGKEGAPVVYRSYMDEKVSVLGGTELKFGDFEPVTNPDVIARMDPKSVSEIYQIDLKRRGIDGYGNLYSTGHGAVSMRQYGLIPAGPSVPEILYNGSAMHLSRYPNTGYITIDSLVDAGTSGKIDTWYKTAEADRPPIVGATFRVSDGRILRWQTARDAWAFAYWTYDWSDQTVAVKSIDAAKSTITTEFPPYYAPKAGQRMYIYNLLEELDESGEWFYDRDSGILYIYPPDTNKDSSILLSFFENSLIKFNKAENVTVRELDLRCTRSTAVMMTNSKNIKLQYCIISNVSGNGVNISGCSDSEVRGCDISKTGECAIRSINGDQRTLTPSNVVIVNNKIHEFGRLVRTYEGGILLNGCGNIAKYNLIYDGPHLGMKISGNDQLVLGNEVHNVLKESSDMGALYFDIGMTNRGIEVKNNLIHDLTTDSTQDHVIQAIYLDNSSSGVAIENNIIYNVVGDGVFVNGGRNNTINNNIFAKLRYSITLKASAYSGDWYNRWLDGSRTFGLTGENALPYTSELYSKYPNMNDIMSDNPPEPKYNKLTGNLNYGVEKEMNIELYTTNTGLSMEDFKKTNEVSDGVVTNKNIGFASLEASNYTVLDNSEAAQSLPETLNVKQRDMGLITSRLKSVLSDNAVAMVIGKPTAYVNWKRCYIDPNDILQVPFIRNDITYIPVRFLAESLSGSADYTDGEIIITYNGKEIRLKENSAEAFVNGSVVTLDGEVIVENGRSYLPLRSVSNLLDKRVLWDDCGLVIVSSEELDDRMDGSMIEELAERL